MRSENEKGGDNMVWWDFKGLLPDRDQELIEKLYRCLVKECDNPLYALKILRLTRRRIIFERNAGRFGGR